MPCENCGKLELRNKLKKKRFCSVACAKPSKVQEAQKPHDEADTVKNNNVNNSNSNQSANQMNTSASGDLSTPMDTSSSGENTVPVAKWSVKEVCKFVAEVLGTDDYTEDFTTQEIDGSALVLLKEKHLVNAMGMKLGPALKIVAKVQSLQGTDADQANPTVPTSNP